MWYPDLTFLHTTRTSLQEPSDTKLGTSSEPMLRLRHFCAAVHSGLLPERCGAKAGAQRHFCHPERPCRRADMLRSLLAHQPHAALGVPQGGALHAACALLCGYLGASKTQIRASLSFLSAKASAPQSSHVQTSHAHSLCCVLCTVRTICAVYPNLLSYWQHKPCYSDTWVTH